MAKPVLLWKESLFDGDPSWIIEGQFPDENFAKDRAKLLAQAAPEGHSTGRYAIKEIDDPPGTIFKASVPDTPTVSLRKQKE